MITFNKVSEILKSLPIGYYLGGVIDCTLEDSDQSYHNPVENKIVIGYKQLPLGKLNENDPEVENMVRCMLYHEVSHAMLTPKMNITSYMNIFEDQRIETLLKGFYHRVNFEEFVRKVNNHTKPETPKTADEYYYQIVRFGEGPQTFVNWRNRIISDWSNINPTSHGWKVTVYEQRVTEFYKAIVKDFNQFKQNQQNQAQSQDQESNGQSGNQPNSQTQTDNEKDEETKNPSTLQANNDDSGNQEKVDGQIAKDMLLDPNRKVDAPTAPTAPSQKEIEMKQEVVQQRIPQLVNFNNNTALKSQVKTIFENARKKKGMQAGALKTYSGKLNPKLINRPGKVETYKWWEKANQNSDSNRFAKIQLNLFCDVSGSFYQSEKKLNDLIASLIELEKTNKDFSFNVVKVGWTVRLDKDRQIKCEEGSCLKMNVIDIYKSLQTPNTSIYNLVVFDGDIQEGIQIWDRDQRAFSAFNHQNCIVISDPSNQGPLDKYAPNAKRIYAKTDYAAEFETNVLAALRLLVR